MRAAAAVKGSHLGPCHPGWATGATQPRQTRVPPAADDALRAGLAWCPLFEKRLLGSVGASLTSQRWLLVLE